MTSLLVFSINLLLAQQWQSYYPTAGFDINSVHALGSGSIALGGGKDGSDSVQLMFHTNNYGTTWAENSHDGYAPWIKSIAFADMVNGFGAGTHGRIIQTIDSGVHWGFAVNPVDRTWNKIVNVDAQTYFIAGGIQSNDSMQTILKTTNNGANWITLYDHPGPWLKGIYFTDTANGIAVGDSGIILKTTNGGNVWAPVAAPIQRDFNAVVFNNADTGYIAGGNTNHRTILRTVNGGSTWTIVFDTDGGILNDISFANDSVAYAVGDSATVLKTSDGGLNWTPEIVSINMPVNSEIRTVSFYNEDFGVIAGKSGLLYVYKTPFPFAVLKTGQATSLTNTSAVLNATLDKATKPMELYFEYDTSYNFTHSIQASPAQVNDTLLHHASASVTGLFTNTLYYYRIRGRVASGSVYYGDIKQFYAAGCEVPNCDFELWDTRAVDKPAAWNMLGDVRKVPSYNGTTAVEIRGPYGAILLADLPGAASETPNYVPGGGVPFTARPDSLVFHAKYDIAIGDTALVLLFFKKNGVIFDQNIFKISGNSGGSFTTQKYQVQFSNNTTPDSILVAFMGTNLFGNHGNANSVLTIDDVSFTGTGNTLPNRDFEQWNTVYESRPGSWTSTSPRTENEQRVSDCVSGRAALDLSNITNHAVTLIAGDTDKNFIPSFPVLGKHVTLNLFLKYLQQGRDSLEIRLTMFKNDTNIGSAYAIIDTPILNYTPMSFDINYGYFDTTPDSAALSFNIGSQFATCNSSAFIDNISFDGFRTTIIDTTISHLDVPAEDNFKVYPNPANNNITIEWNKEGLDNGIIQLMDLNGRMLRQLTFEPQDNLHLNISVAELESGFYFIRIESGNVAFNRKISVIK